MERKSYSFENPEITFIITDRTLSCNFKNTVYPIHVHKHQIVMSFYIRATEN